MHTVNHSSWWMFEVCVHKSVVRVRLCTCVCMCVSAQLHSAHQPGAAFCAHPVFLRGEIVYQQMPNLHHT